VPVVAPQFKAQGFGEQVVELLAQITPTPESEQAASHIAQLAESAIKALIPEAQVVGIASSDICRGTAFGVAVPELYIVASASAEILLQSLQGRLSKGGVASARADKRKLQKSAIRVCTDQLVTEGGFKFRRSAFRGQEPKVTLMAPAPLGVSGTGIPVDFSVNCTSCLYNAALLAESEELDPRASALALLVRRWAKDRGVCHAAKGHLPPYAWTLLAFYFLQVGVEGGPLLPPLHGFKQDTGLAVRIGGGDVDVRRGKKRWEAPPRGSPAPGLSVGELFQGFFHFYASEMEWQKEAVSVRLGRRAPANPHLMLHIMAREGDARTMEVGPSIEDPFEPARNLGTSMTLMGLSRMREEMERAQKLLAKGCPSLSALLEPWAPSDRREGSSDEEAEGEVESSPAAPSPRTLAARSPPPWRRANRA